MAKCHRCETLPERICLEGTLYLVPPIEPVSSGLRGYLTRAGLPFSEPHPDIFAVPLADSTFATLCREYLLGLGRAEQHDTRSLVLAEGRTPSVQELAQMQPLSTLLARVQGQWLVELIGEERLTSHFQPIVTCAATPTVHGHECLLRGQDRDGAPVAPGLMFELAREADLLFQLDRAARLSAIASAVRQGVRSRLFINFNPTAIYTPEYCLRSTLAAIEQAGIAPENVVFEVVESDTTHDVRHLIDVVRFYRERGFRIALDDLGAGYASLSLLHHLRPDYVKLDIELVRGVHADPYKAKLAANVLELARDLGMTSVAEGIETRAEYEWFAAHGADLAQGYFFGRPGPRPVEAVTLDG